MASLRRTLVGLSRSWISHIIPHQQTSTVFPMTSHCCYKPRYALFSTDSSNINIQNRSPDIDFSSEENKRRLINSLLYRSKQRGFLELDLVLGKWVEEHIYHMDVNGIKALVDVLDLENPDLWKWLTSQEQPPEAIDTNPVFCTVRDKVTKNLSNAAPETRAAPGQPWVRGWDDFRKPHDGPISGNQ